jgi:DNA-binding transcriptional regulator LsrR (DeoR family)
LALETLNEVDIALVGIGAATPSSHLTQGVNFFSDEQFARARELGAVGEINLRFLDKDGNPVRSELDDVIIGVELEQLRRAERRIGVSVGSRKHPAVLAALRGGWVNVLVTDIDTATFLLEKADS